MNEKLADSKWIDLDDAPELTKEWFAKAKFMVGEKEVTKRDFDVALQKRRGRPFGSIKTQPKEQTTLRIDVDILAMFRSTGKGWQTRMNSALRQFIADHPFHQ